MLLFSPWCRHVPVILVLVSPPWGFTALTNKASPFVEGGLTLPLRQIISSPLTLVDQGQEPRSPGPAWRKRLFIQTQFGPRQGFLWYPWGTFSDGVMCPPPGDVCSYGQETKETSLWRQDRQPDKSQTFHMIDCQILLDTFNAIFYSLSSKSEHSQKVWRLGGSVGGGGS